MASDNPNLATFRDHGGKVCPYPALAHWTGVGRTDDAANFVCN